MLDAIFVTLILHFPSLHSAETGNLLATVWTRVDDIFASIKTERNQAASKAASNKPQNTTNDPCEGSCLVFDGRDHLSPAVRATGVHW
jgi:hypothetical protein